MQKIVLPGGIKSPGAIWTIIFVVAGAIIHRYVEDPFWLEIAVLVIGLALPLFIENNAELKKAIGIIGVIMRRSIPVDMTEVPSEFRSGPQATRAASAEPIVPISPEAVPEIPSFWKTYWGG